MTKNPAIAAPKFASRSLMLNLHAALRLTLSERVSFKTLKEKIFIIAATILTMIMTNPMGSVTIPAALTP